MERELMLIKLNADPTTRSEVKTIVDIAQMNYTLNLVFQYWLHDMINSVTLEKTFKDVNERSL